MRNRVPGAAGGRGAVAEQRVGPAAGGLQVGDGGAARVHSVPVLAAVVGGPQVRTECPAVAGVEEPQPGDAGRGAGAGCVRGREPLPGLTAVVGARDRRADVRVGVGTVTRGPGRADHPPGAQRVPGHRVGQEAGRQVAGCGLAGARRAGRRGRGAGAGYLPGGRARLRHRRVLRRGGAARCQAALGWRRAQVQRQARRHGHRDRRGGGRRRDHRLADLAAPGPPGDQLEGAVRRRERLHLLVQPAVDRVRLVVSWHRRSPGRPGPA